MYQAKCTFQYHGDEWEHTFMQTDFETEISNESEMRDACKKLLISHYGDYMKALKIEITTVEQ